MKVAELYKVAILRGIIRGIMRGIGKGILPTVKTFGLPRTWMKGRLVRETKLLQKITGLRSRFGINRRLSTQIGLFERLLGGTP